MLNKAKYMILFCLVFIWSQIILNPLNIFAAQLQTSLSYTEGPTYSPYTWLNSSGTVTYTSYRYSATTESFDMRDVKNIEIKYTVTPEDGGINEHINENYPAAPTVEIINDATGSVVDTFYGTYTNSGLTGNVHLNISGVYHYYAQGSGNVRRWMYTYKNMPNPIFTGSNSLPAPFLF